MIPPFQQQLQKRLIRAVFPVTLLLILVLYCNDTHATTQELSTIDSETTLNEPTESNTMLVPPTVGPNYFDLFQTSNLIVQPRDNYTIGVSITEASMVKTPIESEPTEPKPGPEPESEPEPKPLLPSITALDAETQQQVYYDVCHEDKTLFCLLMAVARQETNFNPSRIGDDGLSYGIVQIMVMWHEDRLAKFGYTVEDLLDPIKCFRVGLDYLEELAGRPEKLEVNHELLMGYNMGPDVATAAIRNGHYSSDYSCAVMSYFEDYMTEFSSTQSSH